MLKLCKGCFTMKNIRGKKIICKKCEDAENILSKKRIEEYKEEEILKKQNWIKQRDKLLKEDIK